MKKIKLWLAKKLFNLTTKLDSSYTIPDGYPLPYYVRDIPILDGFDVRKANKKVMLSEHELFYMNTLSDEERERFKKQFVHEHAMGFIELLIKTGALEVKWLDEDFGHKILNMNLYVTFKKY
jgi:hypothetical protein